MARNKRELDDDSSSLTVNLMLTINSINTQKPRWKCCEILSLIRKFEGKFLESPKPGQARLSAFYQFPPVPFCFRLRIYKNSCRRYISRGLLYEVMTVGWFPYLSTSIYVSINCFFVLHLLYFFRIKIYDLTPVKM